MLFFLTALHFMEKAVLALSQYLKEEATIYCEYKFTEV